MKHSFTSNCGHSLEVRESGRSTKLFLKIDEIFKRIDDQPLKPAIVTALLQEIVNLKQTVDSLSESCNKLEQDKEYNAELAREAWHVAAQNERVSKEINMFDLTSEP